MKGQLVQRNEAPELYDFAVKNNLIKSETDWQEQKLYGFFSSGDNETTFRLPLYVGYKTIGYDETQHTLGKPLDPALPNITGSFHQGCVQPNTANGAFSQSIGANYSTPSGSGLATKWVTYSFDAASSNSIYSSDVSTVQTPDIPENWVIKYKS